MKMNVIKKSLLAVLIASSAFAFADTAKVISVTGKVEVERGGSWVQLTKDSTVNQGEVVSTGFKSEALIKYKDSVLKMGPLTRVTLEKLASSDVKDDVSVYLNTGTVRSTVNHSENKRVSYTVRNPIAVASVRGSGFGMDGLANIDCDEHGVFVQSADAVDPINDLGIQDPADKDKKDTKKGFANKKGSGGNLAPAEGATNALTNGQKLNPNLSNRGGILVIEGQQISYNSDDGTFNRPKTWGETTHEETNKMGKSASDTEFVKMGGVMPPPSGDGPGGQGSGRVIIKLEFDDNDNLN